MVLGKNQFVERRRKNFKYLKEALSDLEDKLILPEACPGANPSWIGFPLTCREGVDKNSLVQHIEKEGVQTRMLFAGNLIRQPCFDEMREEGTGYRVINNLQTTDRIMERTFWIGVYPGMDEEKLRDMTKIIHGYFSN